MSIHPSQDNSLDRKKTSVKHGSRKIAVRDEDVRQLSGQVRSLPIWLTGFLVGVLVFAFQNCGGYQAMTNPLYDREILASCLGPSCGRDANYIMIFVANNDPISVPTKTAPETNTIDLGGYCDTGGFPDSAIYLEVKQGATTIVPMFRSTAKCDELGRFKAQVTLPSSGAAAYNYALAGEVIVVLRAVDEYFVEHNHPFENNIRRLAITTLP
ncbi:MAG TPA: hypothetical protein PLZ57_06210 [Pseudobdellovibrionaceae bacterium]|nr:hypothetical protein [Pseudobdellovibrionaceae bacterium]